MSGRLANFGSVTSAYSGYPVLFSAQASESTTPVTFTASAPLSLTVMGNLGFSAV
jgi:hypothetical protein